MSDWELREDWEEYILVCWNKADAKTPADKLLAVIAENSVTEEEVGMFDLWDEVMFSDYSQKCCCGHDTDYTFLLKNYETGVVVSVGLDCIKKHFPEVVVQQATILKKELQGGNKRMCVSCLKRLIGTNEPTYVDRCRACYVMRKEPALGYKKLKYLPCGECGSKEIPPNAPTKKMCNECFDVYKEMMNECEKCGEKKIPQGWFTTLCSGCKDGGDVVGGMRECPQCKLMKIPAGDAWRKTCGSCWYKNKK